VRETHHNEEGAVRFTHRQGFPDQADQLLEMLVKLDRLRRAGESKFPAARAFIRPGLDE
jgi:hypothetical protein